MFSLEHRDAIEGPGDISNIRLLWTDIPYGTGKVMRQGGNSFKDFSDVSYVLESIRVWLPAMAHNGTVVVCCDYRAANKVVNTMRKAKWHYNGEIIWEFGLGRPREDWWPVRHNNLLTFSKKEKSGIFHKEAVPKAKRLAPKPGYSSEKPSGSVWDFTMSNTHPDRVGYPNQKPIEIIEPFVLAHTNAHDLVVDIFCGSSSTGVAALKNNRAYIGVDNNWEAISISKERLAVYGRPQ